MGAVVMSVVPTDQDYREGAPSCCDHPGERSAGLDMRGMGGCTGHVSICGATDCVTSRRMMASCNSAAQFHAPYDVLFCRIRPSQLYPFIHLALKRAQPDAQTEVRTNTRRRKRNNQFVDPFPQRKANLVLVRINRNAC